MIKVKILGVVTTVILVMCAFRCGIIDYYRTAIR